MKSSTTGQKVFAVVTVVALMDLLSEATATLVGIEADGCMLKVPAVRLVDQQRCCQQLLPGGECCGQYFSGTEEEPYQRTIATCDSPEMADLLVRLAKAAPGMIATIARNRRLEPERHKRPMPTWWK
jgi:hypothetical protein